MDKIKEIINCYMNHHFSAPTQCKFQWWLVNDDAQEEKNKAMKAAWDSLSANGSTKQTMEDLDKIRNIIRPPKTNRKAFMRYAAAIAAVVVSSVVTYYTVSRQQENHKEECAFIQLTVPDGDLRSLTLPDDTKVIINAGSTLIYPDTFLTKTRTVFLIGQASFHVKPDKVHPFVVKTQRLTITALGTQFDVTAWPNCKFVSTTLKNGQTLITINNAKGNPSNQQYIMQPNHQLIYNKENGNIGLSNVNASAIMAWERGDMIFDGDNIQSVLQTIERHFGVTIYCNDISKMHGSYHIKFQGYESLQNVLDVLKSIETGFSYHIEGKSVYLSYHKK